MMRCPLGTRQGQKKGNGHVVNLRGGKKRKTAKTGDDSSGDEESVMDVGPPEAVPKKLRRPTTTETVSVLSTVNNGSSSNTASAAHLKEMCELRQALADAIEKQQKPNRRDRNSVFEDSLLGRELKAYVRQTLFRGCKFMRKGAPQMMEHLIPTCFRAMRIEDQLQVGLKDDFSSTILYAISQQRNRVAQEMARIFKGKLLRQEGGKIFCVYRLLTSLVAPSSSTHSCSGLGKGRANSRGERDVGVQGYSMDRHDRANQEGMEVARRGYHARSHWTQDLEQARHDPTLLQHRCISVG